MRWKVWIAWGLLSLCVIRTVARATDWQTDQRLWEAEWQDGSQFRAAVQLRNTHLTNGDPSSAALWCVQLWRLASSPARQRFVRGLCPSPEGAFSWR